jgi:hypothetical protein
MSAHISKEEELVQALYAVERRRLLPDSAEVEPGAFLYMVKDAWEQAAGRDGRRGHLSEGRIATLISKRIGRNFSRNQYQAMFGEGRRLGGMERYSQPIPRDVAEAFLGIAFLLWKRPPPDVIGIDFLPIEDPHKLDLAAVARHACDVMYGTEGEDRLIYCRPGQGRGALGLYRESGKFRRSLLLASPHDPIVITDPEQHVLLWQEVMRYLLIPAGETVSPDSSDNGDPIHIWAFREPAMRHDGRSAAAMLRLGRLRSVLMFTRGVGVSDAPTKELWDEIEKRCVIAMRRRGSPAASHESCIVDDLIFPTEVPSRWSAAGAPARIDALMSVVSFEWDRPDYHVTDVTSESHAIISVSSPGQASDASFSNLFRACRAFVASGGGSDPEGSALLKAACRDGWAFMSPAAFLRQSFPLAPEEQTEKGRVQWA